MNHKKVYRLYREEGLMVLRRRGRKGAIGYGPQERNLDLAITLREFLSLCADLRGLTGRTTMIAAVAEELRLADVLQQLAGISPRRVRFRPAPGTATEEDVIKIRDRERRLFELVDGVLVEKVMGYWESALAIAERRRCPAGLPARPASAPRKNLRPAGRHARAR